MPLSPNEIRKGLERKGWKKREGHHTFYYLKVEGLTERIHTYVSHSAKEYGKKLLGEMKRQLKFDSVEDLQSYIKCEMSHEEYIQMLKEKGLIR